ncbi:LysM peptidoglycan-binding domain-containing protein [Akkermansiaceae bacterium]|nr:LysM peptidoglycan-binding domain-containing protein [Akkermansiaceae bacterium]
MKMTTRLASLLALFATTGPLLSATELERLRAKCAEQEMQINQLELKIARLTDTPPPSRSASTEDTAALDFKPIEKPSTYTVKAGDSIERISRNTGVSATTINRLNGLNSSSIIHPGQQIKLPGTTASASSAPRNSAAATATRTHTVQSGETYYKISRRYGVSVDDLIAANPNVNHRALRVGQKIKVSAAEEIVSKPTTKPAPSLSSAPSIPISNYEEPAKKSRAPELPVRIDKEITYGEFARIHNTTTSRLDELNGLELDPSTVLAQGSELYLPAQP